MTTNRGRSMERKKTRMGSALPTMATPPTKPTSARTSRSQTGVEAGATEANGLVATSDVPAAEAATAIASAETATAVETKELIDQCGLEDDEDEWEDARLPPRIRECELSEEKKKKYQGFLDLIFSAMTLNGKMVNFHPDDLYEVFFDIVPYLNSEPLLIEDVPFPCSVVGDLCGQLYDLDRVFRKNAKDGKPGWVDHKYVFLGGYVDRGRQSIEIVVALFCIKMLYPDNIFLLRGTHEFMDVNKRYGFLEDFFNRYEAEDVAFTLYYRINESFCYLSVAAIIGDTYYCAHGGISPSFFARRHFNSIHKPIIRSSDHILVQDAVWSDPARGLNGTTFNKERGCFFYFGVDEAVLAMETMNVRGIFRGHTIIDEGFEMFFDVLFSITTATAANGRRNKGAVAVINDVGNVSFRIFEVDPKRVAWEERLRDWNEDCEGDGYYTTMVEVAPESEVGETGAIKRMTNH